MSSCLSLRISEDGLGRQARNMTRDDFIKTLNLDSPPEELSEALRALWFDAKGDWSMAHDLINHLEDPESAWVHAYLHRKEGDTSNARYWYRRAKKTFPELELSTEWEIITDTLLA